MKKYIITGMICSFVWSAQLAWSQQTKAAKSDSSGIYINVTDFHNHHLSLATSCQNRSHYIRLNGQSATLVVNQGGKKTRYKKSSIFGYKDCDSKVHRFYKNTDYVMLNSDKIYIYSRVEEVGVGKGSELDNVFYFSVKAYSDLFHLTIENLKLQYPKETKFHDFLDYNFKDNTELSNYDSNFNKYRLILIYEQSLNK